MSDNGAIIIYMWNSKKEYKDDASIPFKIVFDNIKDALILVEKCLKQDKFILIGIDND